MIESQLANDKIVNSLRAHYGIEVETIQFLPLGADPNASIYKVQAYDRTRFFIKLKRTYDHEQSVTIAKLLWENGIKQVILPITTLEGQMTQSMGDFVIIVYPFIDGEDGFRRNLSDDQWFKLGKTMRQIHDIEVPISVQKSIRRENFTDRWREDVRKLLMGLKLESNDETAQKFFIYWMEKKETIQRLLDRAEALSKKVKMLSPKLVLCHADIHGGNVLLDEKQSIYIVDWDDPMLAPRERDLMFIGAGVANVWNKHHEVEFFYKGYGSVEINADLIAYYRHERILEDIVVNCHEIFSSNHNDREKMFREFSDMFAPQGVVDIALMDQE